SDGCDDPESLPVPDCCVEDVPAESRAVSARARTPNPATPSTEIAASPAVSTPMRRRPTSRISIAPPAIRVPVEYAVWRRPMQAVCRTCGEAVRQAPPSPAAGHASFAADFQCARCRARRSACCAHFSPPRSLRTCTPRLARPSRRGPRPGLRCSLAVGSLNLIARLRAPSAPRPATPQGTPTGLRCSLAVGSRAHSNLTGWASSAHRRAAEDATMATMNGAGGGPTQDLQRADGTAIRVLVVDDEPNLTELLSMALRYEGWQVRTAGAGAEAVRVAREHRPDVVVLDVMLPDF